VLVVSDIVTAFFLSKHCSNIIGSSTIIDKDWPIRSAGHLQGTIFIGLGPLLRLGHPERNSRETSLPEQLLYMNWRFFH